MKTLINIKLSVLIALLVLTQSFLLIHASEHAVHPDDTVSCKLCLAANNLDASLVSGPLQLTAQPLIGHVRPPSFIPYLGTFFASWPLPRAPPCS